MPTSSVVPSLETACAADDERLVAQCRRFVAEHSGEVRAKGGVEQLRDLGVAKGLLGDSMDRVVRLEATVAELRGDLQ